MPDSSPNLQPGSPPEAERSDGPTGQRFFAIAYAILYAASIVAIFPWGTTRGEIWTDPKLYVLSAIALVNFGLLLFGDRAVPSPPAHWRWQAGLWVAFSIAGYVTSTLSDYPERALSGEPEIATGAAFWAIAAIASLSNGLVLRAYPQILRSQVCGLLAGGGLLALASVPQLLDWTIDYTATSGQTLPDYPDNILVSKVARDFQPLGFYSHRGHNSIVLTVLLLLAIVARRWRWISLRIFWSLTLGMGAILLLARTRTTLLVCLLGVGLMLGWRYRRALAIAAVTTVLLVGSITINRPIEGLPVLSQITSDRVFMWAVATRAIAQRPLLGWGFDGLSLAYPYSHSADWKPDVIEIDRYWFFVRTPKGEVRRFNIPSSKAHNQLLDSLISVGIVGTVPFVALCALGVVGLAGSPAAIATPIAIAYLAFAALWFDCAQYTYLFWWAVSLEFWPGQSPRLAPQTRDATAK
ncbi:MAG: O-antigen ligase family protein [Geitlerinemataceae cyanobacterium]